MVVPFILLVLSLAGVFVCLAVPALADLLLLAGPCALASLILVIIAMRRERGANEGRNWILIDGSNVMHWKDGEPGIETVRDVVDHLRALGLAPCVMFDANAGYKMQGRFQNDVELGRLLALPVDRVRVVPRGTSADPWLLTAARDVGARIVTNDRFRDWADAHPEVAKPGHLVRGGYRKGALWLDLEG